MAPVYASRNVIWSGCSRFSPCRGPCCGGGAPVGLLRVGFGGAVVPVVPVVPARRPKSASKKSENPVGSPKSNGILLPDAPGRGRAPERDGPNCSAQLGPSRSYLRRLSGSERTSYASLTSLKRASAALSPG